MSFWKKKPKKSQADTNIGNVLLLMGLITQAQLDEAIVTQRETGSFIGEALVSLGAITRAELATGLKVQAQFRSGKAVEAQLAIASTRVEQRRESLQHSRAVTLQGLEKMA